MRVLLSSLFVALILFSCSTFSLTWRKPAYNARGDIRESVGCEYVEGGRIKLTLCGWKNEVTIPPVHHVKAVLEKVTELYDLKRDYTLNAIIAPPQSFAPTLRGFWNPVSGGITLVGRGKYQELPVTLGVLAHEVMHPILDAQGVPLYRHHCILYTGDEFLELEDWLRERFNWKGIIIAPAVRASFYIKCGGVR